MHVLSSLNKYAVKNFPGGLVINTPHYLCRGRGFHPRAWLRYLVGQLRSYMLCNAAKKKKKRKGEMQGTPNTGIGGINTCQAVINMPGT